MGKKTAIPFNSIRAGYWHFIYLPANLSSQEVYKKLVPTLLNAYVLLFFFFNLWWAARRRVHTDTAYTHVSYLSIISRFSLKRKYTVNRSSSYLKPIFSFPLLNFTRLIRRTLAHSHAEAWALPVLAVRTHILSHETGTVESIVRWDRQHDGALSDGGNPSNEICSEFCEQGRNTGKVCRIERWCLTRWSQSRAKSRSGKNNPLPTAQLQLPAGYLLLYIVATHG